MIKKITALFFMLCSYTAQASNLSGEITNGTLRWSNAANVGSAVMPHGWVNVQPDTVVAWQPGIPSSGANKLTLTLQGASSASAEVSVDVKGIEYVQNGGTEAAPFFAGTATKNGSTYTKSGSGRGAVFYNKTLTYTLGQTPFTLYRPIIELGNLVTALQGKPNGVYQGSIQLSLPFVYKRSNGELVTQRTFSTTIPVQIVNHSVTCDVIAANKAQTINFGVIGADRLLDGTSNKKVVPMGVSCNNPLTFGGVTLSAREATVAGREV
ncbi:hypothetical protein M2G84_22320, partial [Vibrio vulnificus]|nr:hypothetical protein [Vibrio vulnificus]